MKQKNLKILKYILVFLIAVTVFSILQFSLELFLCPDSYYHVKMTEMMIDGKIVHQDFPWMQFSTLKEHYVDHHFLFHILLIPFIAIDPIIGAKIADILFASLAVLAFYLILDKSKIRFSFWWAILLLFSSSSFLFRMILIRVPALSLFFLIIVLFSFYYDFKLKWLKYLMIALFSFFYVWLYGGFIFLIIFAVVFYLTKLIIAKRFEWKEILICFGAVALSIFANPYARNFYSFLKIQVLGTGPFTKIPVGAEWYPFKDWDFLTNNFLAVVFFIAGIIVLIIDIILKKYKIKKELFAFKITLLIISSLFFGLTLRSQRFVELMVPFCLLFGAFCLSDLLKQIDFKKWIRQILVVIDNKQHFYSIRTWLKQYFLLFFKSFIFILVLVVIISIGVNNIISTQASVSNSSAKNVPDLKKAADWLKNNTPRNTIILNLDWSDFPPLFLNNSDNYYGFGLDPTFTYNYNLDLYNKWQNISKDYENAYSTIKNDFKSDYVLVNNKNKKVFSMFDQDYNFEKVFDSKYCRIYRLK
ncbi:MAG: hypothetical protein PHN19_04670 [Patescibacteria group bacterium]|nr:hypothetical protein [Patescibacteria group bacterium]